MDPSCLVTTVQAAGGGVMEWGMFSWHTVGPLVPIGARLYGTAYLSIVSFTLWPPCTHSLMATYSRIMHHGIKFKSFQIGFLNMTMSSKTAPTVTRSQPNSAFGKWWNGSFVPWMCIP